MFPSLFGEDLAF